MLPRSWKNVIGPRRPINIKIIITILEPILKYGVTPVETPTVPKAENVSNMRAPALFVFKPIASTSKFFSNAHRATKNKTIVVNANKTRDMALTTTSLEKRLWKKVTFLPNIYETIARPIMNKVVVFTPPAVPNGLPPKNIKKQENDLPKTLNSSWFIEAKPAVRQVTDWNNASNGDLKPSLIRKKTKPVTNKIPVISNEILVNTLNWANLRLAKISMTTKKEIPPATIKNIIYEHK